jgi:CheY-like chemotaxis protein
MVEAEALELDLSQKHVLAIDDEPGVITLMKRYLENDGYQVIGESDPLRAVEVAQSLASDLSAITLDVVMPHVDGWQILRALKENPKTKDIPVLLCTIVEGIERGLEDGAAAYLRKPITREDLLTALRKVERQLA